MNPGSDAGPRVGLVCNDALLSERCRLAVDRDTDWRLFVFTSDDELGSSTDSFDLVVTSVGALTKIGYSAPTLAYGPAAQLRTAFLLSCRDYLRTPWAPDELIVRGERALYRDVLEIGGRRLRFDSDTIEHAGRRVPLRYGEYEVLRLLARSGNGVVSRDELRAVFGYPPQHSRSIDMHVSRVRRKLAALLPGEREGTIRAIRGLGYRVVR